MTVSLMSIAERHAIWARVREKLAPYKRVVLFLAALAFAAGIIVSAHAEPQLVTDIDWRVILLLLIPVLIAIALNCCEFILCGRMIGQRISWRIAVETTVVGGVANMLPLPGGMLVRIAALKSAGASVSRGGGVTLLAAMTWLGIASAYSGVWLVACGHAALGSTVFLSGAAITAAAFRLGMAVSGGWRLPLQLCCVRAALTLFDALRLLLCFAALGDAAHFSQVSVLTVSSFLGAAFSLVPAGLGIREGAAALIAGLVGLTASSAYLATSLNRVLGLLVAAPLAIYIAMHRTEADDAPVHSAAPAVS